MTALPFRIALGALVTVVALSACRDAAMPATPVPTARKVAALTTTSQDSVLAVTLSVSGFAANPIASVSATVDYDTTQLRYVGDASMANGAVRAARDAGGRVVLAAAHAAGFPDDDVMTLHFAWRTAAGRNSTLTPTFTLAVRELMQLDAQNALPELLVTPSASMMRVSR